MYKKIVLSLLLLSSDKSFCYSDNVNAAIVGAVCLVSIEVVRYGNLGLNWIWPSADQVNSETEACERRAFLNTRTKFKECLANPKSKDEMTSDRVPVSCEKEVREFILCGGYHEAIQMTSDFGQQK